MQEKNGWSGAMSTENDDECVRLDTRLAGQVRRYHTWPIVGQQTIADHCWQLMRIYLAVVIRPDVHMVQHIMFHDVGEHFTGDVPYPVKRDNPTLKIEMEFLELRSQAQQLQYWDSFKPIALLPDEQKLFKQIELIEMAEFGLDQVCLGNSHGMIIADRCLRSVYENKPCAGLAKYVGRRLILFYRQWRGGLAEDTDEDWWFEANWENLHANGKSEASGRDPL